VTSGFYMDAEITPARSISRRGRYVVLAITIALALIPTTIFTLMGAPFVLPFMGVDIAGLAFAFWWINRRKTAEQIRVSRETIEVFRDGAVVWRSKIAFTRVDVFETAVRLMSHGKHYSLASALSPMERAQFAGALQLAIIAAKAGSSSPRRATKASS
jgi:uncharacterized membrane protein